MPFTSHSPLLLPCLLIRRSLRHESAPASRRIYTEHMWAYLAAPVLVLLPERWRQNAGFAAPMPWCVASFTCGVAQAVSGLAALVWWYSYSVENWAQNLMTHAVETQSAVAGLGPHEFGVLALTVVAASPVTWLIVVWSVEGIVRVLAAAVTEEVFATLPLGADRGSIRAGTARAQRKPRLACLHSCVASTTLLRARSPRFSAAAHSKKLMLASPTM